MTLSGVMALILRFFTELDCFAGQLLSNKLYFAWCQILCHCYCYCI